MDGDEQITFNENGNSVAVRKVEGGFRIIVDGSHNTCSIDLTAMEFEEFHMDVLDFYKRFGK